ncbi:Spy/CpxP family protein refolding chaperone [Kingella oralis]|uniref:Spy/CpxP family protein refolding chaperone n=1 Tax=Kingella oralis TaxID=505 RepID=UPI002D810417|nr:Spy/CpxP family protein refolding chaperone [Kingella oralis]
MKRSTLLASTAALLLSAGVAVAAGEAAKQQPANDMPPPPHGDRQKPHHSDKMRNKFKRDGLPRGFDELGLSEAQKSKIRDIMAQHRPRQPENTPARRAEFQQKMAQRQSQEQQLINSKNFDEQAARKLIAERQQERAELERQHAERELQMLKARHAAFQVLTPAQQQKYIALEKQQQQRFAERMARHQPPEAPIANK